MSASRSIQQRLVSLQPAWLIAALAGFVLLFFGNNAFSLLLAGIALFILGMRYLENGFRAFTGGALERWLAACTSRLWKSLLFGGLTTALVQSSSLITLLSIAFLSAGLISLTAGIGIVFGANLGTTTGAWLIALVGLKVDLSQIAMPMLVLGVIFERNKSAGWRGGGQVLLGIGLLFLGIDQMKLGFSGMEAALDLSAFAAGGWQSLLLYAALGTLATVLMQSSHATLMITLTALASGQLGYIDALAMAVGANLGTTITALIAAFSANNAGRQLAAAHIVFNLVTAVVALAILPSLAQLVDALSSWLGIDDQALTLKLALFHTLFNLLGLLIMLPLVPSLVRGLQRWLPAAVEPDEDLSQQPRSRALYLNDAALVHADTALKVLQQELAHLASLSYQVIAAALYLPAQFVRDMAASQNLDSRLAIPPLAAREDADALYHQHIKGVYADIIAFRSRLDGELLPQQQQQLMDDMLSARDLVEAVKAAKHLQSNLRKHVDSQRPALREGYRQLREQGRAVLSVLARGSVEGGVAAERRSAELAEEQRMFSAGFERHLHEQLRSGELDGWQATSLLNDLNYLKQIGEHLRAAHDMIYTRAALRSPD